MADPSSDTAGQSPRMTPSGGAASETATHTPAPSSGPKPDPTYQGAEAIEPVDQVETASENIERPGPEGSTAATTNESIVSAPSGEQSEDLPTPTAGLFFMPGAPPSDGTGAPDDAGTGPRSPLPEAQSEMLIATDDEESPEEQPGEQPKEQSGYTDIPSQELWKEVGRLAIEEAPSHGIEVTDGGASEAQPSTALPSQPDEANAENDEGGVGVGVGSHTLPGETRFGPEGTTDEATQPQAVKSAVEAILHMDKDQEIRLLDGLDDDGKALLELLHQSLPDDKAKIDDYEKEAGRLMLEHMRGQERKRYKEEGRGSGLDAAEGEGEHADGNIKGLTEAGDRTNQHGKKTEGVPDMGQALVERRRIKKLQFDLDDTVPTPKILKPDTVIQGQHYRTSDEELDDLLGGLDVSESGADSVKVGAGSEHSPLPVADDKDRNARNFLRQNRHLLEPGTQLFRTITSVVDYIEGEGDRPSSEAMEEFAEFQDFAAHRVRVLREVLGGEEPLAAIQRFDDHWSAVAWDTVWGARLGLRLAAVRAAAYTKHGEDDSPEYVYALMFFDHLLDRLGDDYDDPVALQIKDMLSSAVKK